MYVAPITSESPAVVRSSALAVTAAVPSIAPDVVLTEKPEPETAAESATKVCVEYPTVSVPPVSYTHLTLPTICSV